jgi:hypothetical protein
MRRDGVWFHDRGWPTDPLNPPGRRRSGRVALGPGSAAFFIRQRLRAFGCTLNVRRAACPLRVISRHVRCTSACPVSANSGHRRCRRRCSPYNAKGVSRKVSRPNTTIPAMKDNGRLIYINPTSKKIANDDVWGGLQKRLRRR